MSWWLSFWIEFASVWGVVTTSTTVSGWTAPPTEFLLFERSVNLYQPDYSIVSFILYLSVAFWKNMTRVRWSSLIMMRESESEGSVVCEGFYFLYRMNIKTPPLIILLKPSKVRMIMMDEARLRGGAGGIIFECQKWEKETEKRERKERKNKKKGGKKGIESKIR